MMNYEKPLEPYCNHWAEYGKEEFIMKKIREICISIANKGPTAEFEDIFDMIYIHIDENINDFLPEAAYEYSE